jgi:hypothetical protein
MRSSKRARAYRDRDAIPMGFDAHDARLSRRSTKRRRPFIIKWTLCN